jgi:cytochrome c-type biogenesis protein CcmH/NrfG
MKQTDVPRLRFGVAALAALLISVPLSLRAQTDDRFATSLEAALRNPSAQELESLRAQLEERIRQDPNEAQSQYQLARVHAGLADAAEIAKDKKTARPEVDRAIDAAQRSIQLNESSADAHSLLADLYGRKISLGNAMFAGPRYGPKVDQENKRAMALDDKDSRVWASIGRQLLMTPKAFGGDVPRAIDSFQKSLALDNSNDATWYWLARAYQKQGDKTKAREALDHALQLNPKNPLAQQALQTLNK